MIGATDAYKFREGERYTDFAYHLTYFFDKGTSIQITLLYASNP